MAQRKQEEKSWFVNICTYMSFEGLPSVIETTFYKDQTITFHCFHWTMCQNTDPFEIANAHWIKYRNEDFSQTKQ